MLRFGFVFVLVAGCDPYTTPGDRAFLDGGCPPSEPVCSPSTPMGLQFDEPDTSDLLVESHPAVGGRFSLGVESETGPLPDFVFELDETLVLENVERLGDRTARVELSSLRASRTRVRVVATDGSGLLDRISLETRALDEIQVHPLFSLEQDGRIVALFGLDLDRWEIWHEVDRLTVIFALYDALGGRLVHEGLSTSSSVPAPEDAQTRWDTLALELGDGDVEVTAAGRRFPLRRASSFDDIAVIPQATHPVLSSFRCFVATRAGVPVIGVPLTSRTEDYPTPFPLGLPTDEPPYFTLPCVPTSERVTVEGPGISRVFEAEERP